METAMVFFLPREFTINRAVESNHRMAGLLGQKGRRSRSHCDEGQREACRGARETQGEMAQEGHSGSAAGDPHVGRMDMLAAGSQGLPLMASSWSRSPLLAWVCCSVKVPEAGSQEPCLSGLGVPAGHFAVVGRAQGAEPAPHPTGHWGWALSSWTVAGSPWNPFHMWRQTQS